ncbi:flavin reductase [Catellatospora sp. NPDC049133]|uniref:flavin reductase n=1 Tax=Catellatospora sp. NPDC049133 TaxID=3155499 RepID=UPI0033C9DF3C
MDGNHLRSVLSQWPSGVAVVTTMVTEPDGARRPHGMTASSFSSVSLDPPLVSVCLGNHLPTRLMIEQAGVFALSFLGKDQAEIGRRFAGARPGEDRFTGLDWLTGQTGCPMLADATGRLDCTVEHAYPGGDHTIFVGRVVDAAVPRVTAPLLFHSRAWGQLADPLPEEITMTVLDGPAAERAHTLLVRDPGDVAQVAAAAAHAPVLAYVADAFSPAREADVLAAIDALAGLPGVTLGCAETSPASPLQVRRVLQDAVVRARPAPVHVRLLAHHGLGLVNALVAMKSGVHRFDTVLDPGSGGLPAQDLLLLARQLGVACAPLPAVSEELT